MRSKFDGFFKTTPLPKTENSNNPLPKINKGSIKVNTGGCFGERNIEITLPHVILDHKKTDEVAKEHTYTFKY